MVLKRGKLVIKKGSPQIEIDGKLFNPARVEVSRSIIERLNNLNGAEVEFELQGGQPKRIRLVGEDFVPAQASAINVGASRTSSDSSKFQQTTNRSISIKRDFHNPYNFIPAPPRKTDDPDLGDHRPVTQDRFYLDRITGRIRVTMEAITPLLVPDPVSCREEGNGHKTFQLLFDKDGKPLLPSSSVRGMLRSAYEAVTNSRFGRFSYKDHSKRLAYRMEAREGLRLIPARIESGKVRLLTGTSIVGTDGKPDVLYAAWLPRYSGSNKSTDNAVKYPDGSLPQHGDEVVCCVRKIEHKNRFHYWNVFKIAKGSDKEKLNCSPTSREQKEVKKIHGWVCVTNANINRKHDERVFFCEGKTLDSFPLTDELRRKWEELIGNYQEIHKDDLEKRKKQACKPDEYLGSKPGQTAWSRHVYRQEDLELRDGTLCYARLSSDRKRVEALFPVMISRDLYPASPWELLDSSLRPAFRIEELSPADRVFGWVPADSERLGGASQRQAAVRGLLRVGTVTCASSREDSVEEFARGGFPLAILAAPKPQQGRFYVAKTPNGEAQSDGKNKLEAGYACGKGLRGRKIYPHHAGLDGNYWKNPMEDRTQSPNGPWQEYRRPRKGNQEQRDDQNRSMLGWIKPGTRFDFDIHVMNLSKVELGALLWLLNLPANHFHRFGGGKPLGFGSVQLRVEAYDLWTGEDLKRRYGSWNGSPAVDFCVEAVIDSYKNAAVRSYFKDKPKSFDQIPFITAFLRACKGFDDGLYMHYPRATASGSPKPPSPDGESFKWFVINEKKENCFVLPDLASDSGLPTLKES